MQYLEQIKKRRTENLRDKFRNKPYSETWGAVRSLSLVSTFILQTITAFCALGLPAFGVYVLFGSWYVGFAVGAVLLLAFESIKRIIVNNSVLSYYRRGRVSVISAAGVLLCLAASIGSSYFGTPILVQEFSPAPESVNKSAISSRFDSMRVATVAYWQGVKSEHLSKAEEIHAQNNWKGVTTRDARGTKLALEHRAVAAQDSINTTLANIAALEAVTLQEAEASYKDAVRLHNTRKEIVGDYFALATLVMELLFICAFVFLNHYDFHEACELGLLEAGESRKSINKSLESTDKPIKVEEVKAGQRHGNGIGFHNEGGIVTSGNLPKVLCRKSNGELKAYTKSELSTLAGDAERKGNETRAKYWLEMRGRLEKYLNRV